MDYNIQCFSLPSFTLAKWNSQFKALVHLFFLYHSIERIIEVLNFPYYAQHQNVIWYWPKSLIHPQNCLQAQNLIRNLIYVPTHRLLLITQGHPFTTFILSLSFFNIPSGPCLCSSLPLAFFPTKIEGDGKQKRKKKKKNIKSRPSLGAENSVQHWLT